MNAEFDALLRNGTWLLVAPPPLILLVAAGYTKLKKMLMVP
jgi:hypothetical protein